MSEAYAIYDLTNERYLIGGTIFALFYEHTDSPLQARLFDEKVKAVRLLKSLNTQVKKKGGWDALCKNRDAIPEPDLVVHKLSNPVVEPILN